MGKREIRFVLNDTEVLWEIESHTTLLQALRDHGITSVKRGCEEGECGSCTIVIDGEAQKSCLYLALEVEGKTVLTSEGLTEKPGVLHPIQLAYIEEGAIQCGFCTPGFIMSTYALLLHNNNPTDDQIRDALGGNLCRCTGYLSIFKAVRKAALSMNVARKLPEQGRGE
jgi:carbon-monoxide dehydrogenase small subunit